MVLWDCAPMLGLENEEPIEEIQLLAVNVTTRSKGPLIEDNTLFPKIKKIQENMKKIRNNTQTQPVPNLVITRKNAPTIRKPVKATENKVESIKKSSTECEMGYDIIEDIKNTKENISLFKMCNLPQQRRKLLKAFDALAGKPQEDIHLEEEISEASIGGKSKSKTLPFLLTFDIFNHNVHKYLVDSGACANVNPL